MKRTIISMTRTSYLAVLTMLMTLASGVWANFDPDQVMPRVVFQPDGTLIEYWIQGWHRTSFVDGYVFVPISGDDGWYYYAELDARGDYVASPYKVRVDDPVEIGIPLNLQRSAVRQAEKDAAYLIEQVSSLLIQPDGTTFRAYSNSTLPSRNRTEGGISSHVPGDGYVIAIYETPLINYNGGDPFWAFVYDEESGWYYYAECLSHESGVCLQTPRGEYVASPYKVGIDDPPGYNPAVTSGRSSPTVVQQRSWGAVKHLFHK